MSNQMAGLRAANIRVETLNSSTPMEKKDLIMDDLKSGHPMTRLLYVTPEYCLGERFRDTMKIVNGQQELARIAIDEAHCIR
jgi:bloom syndrome protein